MRRLCIRIHLSESVRIRQVKFVKQVVGFPSMTNAHPFISENRKIIIRVKYNNNKGVVRKANIYVLAQPN